MSASKAASRLLKRNRLGQHLVTQPRLQSGGGYDIDLPTENPAERILELTETDKAHPRLEIDQDVDVTSGTVRAPGHTSEDANVLGAEFLGRRQQLTTLLGQ